MIWNKVNRFKHPEDGQPINTEFTAQLPSPTATGPKMVDDWKKSITSVGAEIRSKHMQSGFLPTPSSVNIQQGSTTAVAQHRRGRETIFSMAVEQDESLGPGFYAADSFALKKSHVAVPMFNSKKTESRKKEADRIADAELIPGPGAYHHRSSMLVPTFNHEKSVHLDKEDRIKHKQQMQRRMSSAPNHLLLANNSQSMSTANHISSIGAVPRASSMFALGQQQHQQPHRQLKVGSNVSIASRSIHAHSSYNSDWSIANSAGQMLFEEEGPVKRSTLAERSSLFASLVAVEKKLSQQQEQLNSGYEREVIDTINSDSFEWDPTSPLASSPTQS